jgi:VCBS repeat-containing protein
MKKVNLQKLALLITVVGLGACSDDYQQPKINLAPIAESMQVITQTEVVVQDQLTASDPDNDQLTFSLVSTPALGTAVVNADGTYIYTPNIETTGADSFVFSVSDGVNLLSTATVSITIESLEVDFITGFRSAFSQDENAEPIRINGRTFTDKNRDADLSDLVEGQ